MKRIHVETRKAMFPSCEISACVVEEEYFGALLTTKIVFYLRGDPRVFIFVALHKDAFTGDKA